MAKLEAIIWDWGMVLGRFDHGQIWHGLAGYSELYSKAIQLALEEPAKRHDAGLLSSKRFYFEACSKALLKGLDYEKFREIWNSCILGDNEDIAPLLRRVAPSVRMTVLSNTDPINWAAIQKLPLMQEFFPNKDSWTLSYEVGARKPANEAYFAALKRSGLAPNQSSKALFVDDVMNYTEQFKRLGGQAFQYNNSTQKIDVLEWYLLEAGVISP